MSILRLCRHDVLQHSDAPRAALRLQRTCRAMDDVVAHMWLPAQPKPKVCQHAQSTYGNIRQRQQNQSMT